MNRQIEAVNSQFPKHREALSQLMRGAGGTAGDKAAAIGAYCREHRITDFPNPFPGGDERRDEWAGAFGLQAQEPVIAKIAEDRAAQGEEIQSAVLLPNFNKMTKEQIEQFAIDNFDTNISTRMTKAKMIERVKELAEG